MIEHRNRERTKQALLWITLLLNCLLLAACSDNSTATPQGTATPGLGLTPDSTAFLAIDSTPNTADPLIAARLQQEQNALKQPLPVMQLTQGLNNDQQIAQQAAVQDVTFQKYMFAPASKTPVRSEIFGVYPWRDSDLTQATSSCQKTTCYRVELYNYAYNLTAIAVVDVPAKKVLEVSQLDASQPDIPDQLKNLAINIAVNSPQVEQLLGYKPSQAQALMASTKTSLNNSRCERSQHLCVAPTFVHGSDALWAIVDLTDLKLVGVEWTKVGESERLPITEKNLQDQYVTTNFCQHNVAFEQNGWKMNYILTSSDGLRLSDVTFNGQAVLANVKLVDWHVSYSRAQGFGYSDAIGCPVFSQAAVVAVGGPQVEPIKSGTTDIGFTLVQDFKSIEWPAPCNYNYQQRYEFYNDGRFRVVAGSLGRGCGDDGTYRPVFRIRLAASNYSFAEWSGSNWQNWPTERWQLQTPQTAYTSEGYQYRVADASGNGYYIEPGRGQFGDGGQGDNAYTYVTRYHPDIDEGESDMVTIGPCCNTDYQQGPEKFIGLNPEPITNTGLVIWYVPQLKNNGTSGQEYCWAQSVIENGLLTAKTYPCYAGPMFVPLKNKS